jgi:hypothetical protein
MNSKESLRSKIIQYADYIWQTSTHSLHPLVQLMVEELCNELSLLNNKLEEIDSSVLEKLVKTLSPSYNYIRPGHAILQLIPDKSLSLVDKKTTFYIKNISSGFTGRHTASVVFTPVVNIKLIDIKIQKVFTNKNAKFNTLWLGLKISEEIKELDNLFFYLNFPHLNDNHEYYDLLPDIKWEAGGKLLKTQTGLPLVQDTPPSKVEKEVLDFYENHFHLKVVKSNCQVLHIFTLLLWLLA